MPFSTQVYEKHCKNFKNKIFRSVLKNKKIAIVKEGTRQLTTSLYNLKTPCN
jgi:hypothetical protein